MDNYSFNGLNNNNPLAQFLRQYIPQQPQEQPQNVQETQRTNGNGALYEITSPADIDYIEMDRSGRVQIFRCSNEKRIYERRWNHSKQKPDYKEYIEEEETKLSQKNDTSAEMSQVAEALVLVVNKLESLDKTMNEIKNAEPKIIEKIVEKPVEIIKEVIKEVPVIDDVSNSLKELEYKKSELEMINASRKNRGLIKEASSEVTDKTKRDSNGRFAKKGGK